MVRLAVSVVASRQVSPAPRGHTTLIQLQTHCLGSSLATGQHISPRLKLCAAPPSGRQQYSAVSCAVFYDSSSTTYQVPGYSCCIIVLFIRAMVVLVAYHCVSWHHCPCFVVFSDPRLGFPECNVASRRCCGGCKCSRHDEKWIHFHGIIVSVSLV